MKFSLIMEITQALLDNVITLEKYNAKLFKLRNSVEREENV